MISAHLAAAVETTFDVVFFVEFCCRITKPGRKDLQMAASGERTNSYTAWMTRNASNKVFTYI